MYVETLIWVGRENCDSKDLQFLITWCWWWYFTSLLHLRRFSLVIVYTRCTYRHTYIFFCLEKNGLYTMKLFISKLLIRAHQHSQLFLLWNPFHCNKRYLTTCTYVYWYLSAPNFQIQYHIAFANHLHLNCIHQRFQKWSTNISWNFQPILTCLNNTIRKKKHFPSLAFTNMLLLPLWNLLPIR